MGKLSSKTSIDDVSYGRHMVVGQLKFFKRRGDVKGGVGNPLNLKKLQLHHNDDVINLPAPALVSTCAPVYLSFSYLSAFVLSTRERFFIFLLLFSCSQFHNYFAV